MAKLLAMCKVPSDAAAFDRYCFDLHVPIPKRIPGLRRYEGTRGPLASLAGAAPYHPIATLTFDSVAAIRAARRFPEGQAAADIANLAIGGADPVFAETQGA